ALVAAIREGKESPKGRAGYGETGGESGIRPVAFSSPRTATRSPGGAGLLSALPGGTVTFLLIDWHEGREAERTALAVGQALLRREIGRHGGSEMAAVGGAFAAAFARASDAAAGAAACRQAWQGSGSGETPRMALDTGEVDLQEGRY